MDNDVNLSTLQQQKLALAAELQHTKKLIRVSQAVQVLVEYVCLTPDPLIARSYQIPPNTRSLQLPRLSSIISRWIKNNSTHLPPLYTNNVEQLFPQDILFNILSYSHIATLGTLSQTCSYFRKRVDEYMELHPEQNAVKMLYVTYGFLPPQLYHAWRSSSVKVRTKELSKLSYETNRMIEREMKLEISRLKKVVSYVCVVGYVDENTTNAMATIMNFGTSPGEEQREELRKHLERKSGAELCKIHESSSGESGRRGVRMLEATNMIRKRTMHMFEDTMLIIFVASLDYVSDAGKPLRESVEKLKMITNHNSLCNNLIMLVFSDTNDFMQNLDRVPLGSVFSDFMTDKSAPDYTQKAKEYIRDLFRSPLNLHQEIPNQCKISHQFISQGQWPSMHRDLLVVLENALNYYLQS